MSFLDSIMEDYVKNDIKVFREFDMNNFISGVDVAIFQNSGKVSADIELNSYIKLITNANNSLNSIFLSKPLLMNFLEVLQTSDLSNLNIMIYPFDLTEVRDIKPNYLSQFIENMKMTLNRVIDGIISKDDVVRYVSDDILIRVKKQMVRTNISYRYGSKDIIKEISNNQILVTKEFIYDSVIPFLNKYDAIKERLQSEIKMTVSVLDEANNAIRVCINVLNDISENEEDESKVIFIRQVSYNIIRSMLSAASYLGAMMIRKMSIFSDATVTSEKIYNTVTKNDIAFKFTKESSYEVNIIASDPQSLADNLIRGRIDAYEVISKGIIDFHKGLLENNIEIITSVDDNSSVILSNEINSKISGANYSREQYDTANEIYNEISNGFDIVSKNSNDYLIVFDDLREKSGFTINLEDRFSGVISKLDDISLYESEVSIPKNISGTDEIYFRMLHEVNDYVDNMDQLAKNIVDCMTKLDILKDKFENNSNREFNNTEAFNELKIFMSEINEQYKAITTSVAEKFMNRLKKIAILLENINVEKYSNNTQEEITENINFNENTFSNVIDSMDAYTDLIFENMVIQYQVLREEKEYGTKLIVEQEGQQQNQNNTSNQQAQQNNTQTQNNMQQNTQVNKNTSQSQQNSTQQPQQNQNNQQNNSNEKKAKIDKVMQNINTWFENTIKKLDDVVNKFRAQQNDVYFKNNKEALLNHRYSNMSNKTPIINYEHLMPTSTILRDLKTVSGKTTTGYLTPARLQNIKNKNDVRKLIFSFIPSQIWEKVDGNGSGGESMSFGEAIKSYYKSGIYSETPVTLKNGELKTLVENAVNYCEPFFNTTYTTVRKEIEQIKNNISSTVKTLMTEGTLDDAFGSLFLEDNQEVAKNTITNISDSCSDIQIMVTSYCESILSAIFARYKDYMNLCLSIVGRGGSQNNINANQQSQQQNMQQNNNQTQQNNNTNNNS